MTQTYDEFKESLARASAEVASWPQWKQDAARALMGPCRMCTEGIEHRHGAFDDERNAY